MPRAGHQSVDGPRFKLPANECSPQLANLPVFKKKPGLSDGFLWNICEANRLDEKEGSGSGIIVGPLIIGEAT
jgi:hypothetical protein